MNWKETLELKQAYEDYAKTRAMICQVEYKEQAARIFEQPLNTYYDLPWKLWIHVSERSREFIDCMSRDIEDVELWSGKDLHAVPFIDWIPLYRDWLVVKTRDIQQRGLFMGNFQQIRLEILHSVLYTSDEALRQGEVYSFLEGMIQVNIEPHGDGMVSVALVTERKKVSTRYYSSLAEMKQQVEDTLLYEEALRELFRTAILDKLADINTLVNTLTR